MIAYDHVAPTKSKKNKMHTVSLMTSGEADIILMSYTGVKGMMKKATLKNKVMRLAGKKTFFRFNRKFPFIHIMETGVMYIMLKENK